MIPKLPLNSPRWNDLKGVTAEEVRVLLTHVTDDLLADGTVSESAYAVLPRLVEAAAALPPEQSVDFWVDMGFIVTAEDRPLFRPTWTRGSVPRSGGPSRQPCGASSPRRSREGVRPTRPELRGLCRTPHRGGAVAGRTR